MILFKLTNSSLCTPGHQYTLGPNIYVPENGHMYFTQARYIFWYLNYGDILIMADVDNYELIPDDNMGDGLISVPGMATRSCRVMDIKKLDGNTVNYLENIWGADITADNYALFKYAWCYNRDVCHYLVTNHEREFHKWLENFNGMDPLKEREIEGVV